VQATEDKLLNIIGTGGEVVKKENQGKRRLAYEINKFREGIYVLVNFTATADVVNELERVMKISDEIIRYLIVNDVA
jgi:small subunit ribosomal protein S6